MPNVDAASGSIAGAALGCFQRERPDPHHAGAARAENSIVLAAATQRADEAVPRGQVTTAQGRREIEIGVR